MNVPTLLSSKPARRQCQEDVGATQRAEAFPDVCPLHVASSQWAQVTNRQVNVDDANNDRCERV
jgi:hypothetical protein